MLLFTPGPTPVPENIRMEMSKPSLHHRSAEFEAYFARAREDLKRMLNTHEVLMLASTGTGAMEACLRTFCVKKLLSVNSGKFGERFSKIATSYDIPTVEIKNNWDTPVSVEEVLNHLQNNPDTDALCIQVCESSGGVRHPVEKIAQTVKSFNANIVVIVDAITAMGAEEIDVSHIDALIGGSQKAFMLPPGMSIIGLSQRATALAEERNIGFYFNLKTELRNQRNNTTAWTASTSIIIGLVQYFKEIKALGGMQKVYRQTQRRSLATQAALRTIGLKIYPKAPSVSMSVVIDEANALNIRRVLKDVFKIDIAGGQGALRTSIFRINHMGIIPINETLWVINAIELALDRLGIRKFDGSANKVFLDTYYQ